MRGRFRGDGYLLSPVSDGGLPDPMLHGLVAEAGGEGPAWDHNAWGPISDYAD